MPFRFEKLNIWCESRVFIQDIYSIIKVIPKSEQFALSDQIKRAAISIALNIAEGSDKKSDKEFIRYLRISLGSINEVVTCLFIAKDLKYINISQFNNIYDNSHKIAAMINALIRKLNEK